LAGFLATTGVLATGLAFLTSSLLTSEEESLPFAALFG